MAKQIDLQKFHDNVNIKLENVSDLKKQIKLLTDSKDKDGKALQIKVRAVHGGYVNENFRFYRPQDLKDAINTFFTPYEKPVLDGHYSDNIVGRTYAAEFVDIVGASGDQPTCRVDAQSIIFNSDAIEKILDGAFLTVSVGIDPINVPTCSICGRPLNDEKCEHWPGREYDGKTCYMISNGLSFFEYSFVVQPADQSDSHFAGVASIELIDKPERFINTNLNDDKTQQPTMTDDKGKQTEELEKIKFEKITKELTDLKASTDAQISELTKQKDEALNKATEIQKLSEEKYKTLQTAFDSLDKELRQILSERIVDCQIINHTPALFDKLKDCKDVEENKKVIKSMVDSYLEKPTISLKEIVKVLIDERPFTFETVQLNTKQPEKQGSKIKSDKINTLFKVNDINL